MRYIARPMLSEKAHRVLARRTQRVRDASDPGAAADRLWKHRNSAADVEERDVLENMAGQLVRCMYCEDSEGIAVEHFYPRADYPLRTFEWSNHLLACSNCNSNFKRAKFPLTPGGVPLLIDPTAEDPHRHLDFSPTTGSFLPRDEKGRESIATFGLARHTLELHRRTTVTVAGALVVRYDALMTAGNEAEASRVLRSLRRIPHGSVVDWVCRLARGPDGGAVLQPDVIAAIQARPELP